MAARSGRAGLSRAGVICRPWRVSELKATLLPLAGEGGPKGRMRGRAGPSDSLFARNPTGRRDPSSVRLRLPPSPARGRRVSWDQASAAGVSLGKWKEADFWLLLEHRASIALQNQKGPDRFLAIDGFIPQHERSQPTGTIRGKAWVMGGPDGLWDMEVIISGPHIDAYEKGSMLQLLPSPTAKDWIHLDRKAERVFIRLGPKRPRTSQHLTPTGSPAHPHPAEPVPAAPRRACRDR